METNSGKIKNIRDIVKIFMRIILIFITLFLVTRIFKSANEQEILAPSSSVYSQGNAPDSIRNEIISQLRKFQEGYTNRDINQVDTFMQSLYSKDNILILGTMPGEIFRGYERATYLVQSDWESWGDCKFAIDSANISSMGNTAWYSAKGFVKFDLSRFLVLPLRFTGVMVKEDQVWKFQQQQFQFDIDFSFSLIASIILSIWMLVALANLIIKLVKIKRTS